MPNCPQQPCDPAGPNDPPSFCTPTQLLSRYDYRWIANQIYDNGTAATQAQVLNSPIIAEFIQDASEMVLAAATIGERYSRGDLECYGGCLLVRITCGLVLGLILKRRARGSKDEEALTTDYNESLQYLEQLRRAERIFFNVPGVVEAGVPATAPMVNPNPGFGPPFISNNPAIFGNVGVDRNYGNQLGGGGWPGC